MEWFKGKAAQLIALVGIVSTLAGFGYTGATYVNRIENLEKKVGIIKETDEGLDNVVQRFAAIEATVESLSSSKDQVQNMEEAITMLETSVEAINKTIDESLIIEVRGIEEDVTGVRVDIQGVETALKALEKVVDKMEEGGNPLAN
ncbi:MAG: hypothetical protein QGH26_04735 [Candidatus Pacebacteria bacterium]|jgi:exonuclease VII small subunit|nr:hypothetical protein [Candidatus Paceibacterota bacterium]|tara:strand:+ start:394 stop:831 length:438 start_codon:yes stop_codon:yes gene_type:complete